MRYIHKLPGLLLILCGLFRKNIPWMGPWLAWIPDSCERAHLWTPPRRLQQDPELHTFVWCNTVYGTTLCMVQHYAPGWTPRMQSIQWMHEEHRTNACIIHACKVSSQCMQSKHPSFLGSSMTGLIGCSACIDQMLCKHDTCICSMLCDAMAGCLACVYFNWKPSVSKASGFWCTLLCLYGGLNEGPARIKWLYKSTPSTRRTKTSTS